MSDFEEKLNAILSNPDAMSQVMNLAQSLNLGGGGESSSAQQEDSPGPQSGGEAQSGGGSGLGDLTGLGSLLGQIDPAMIQRMLPLVGELTGGGNDERMQLLYALRPFLKPERRDKVERAAKTAKLIHIGKKLLSTMGESNV
ncbi:MAG: hypothetical protein HFF69_00510 [Oscillospiraceae bacterium]|nr:hypothetical protein [Oscillospiraceae bacterium]